MRRRMSSTRTSIKNTLSTRSMTVRLPQTLIKNMIRRRNTKTIPKTIRMRVLRAMKRMEMGKRRMEKETSMRKRRAIKTRRRRKKCIFLHTRGNCRSMISIAYTRIIIMTIH